MKIGQAIAARKRQGMPCLYSRGHAAAAEFVL